jgi:muramoyltetrapeptide carboxypeptidase
MKRVIPPKLQAGDEIRVIAPARSLAIITAGTRAVAAGRFASLGLAVSFGQHAEELDDFISSSVTSRLDDLHTAFADPAVKAVLSVVGGFNSNQLLGGIDWDLIARNPKIFCGFSDITALSNAISAKTGLVTYSGPHYSTFGMEKYFDYVLASFRACLLTDAPYELRPIAEYTNDEWFIDQDHRTAIPNDGWWVLHEGRAGGTIIGGNLSTLNLLQGTPYMPTLAGRVLFIEDDAESLPHHFDRGLVSLIQQPGFSEVRALVIGRFQPQSQMTRDILGRIISTKAELTTLPVIANVDFGHTNQLATFPIGGDVEVTIAKLRPIINITSH